MERTKYTPKRLLSLLLALIMLLGMFPTAVFAADNTLTTTHDDDTENVVFDASNWTNNNAQIGFVYSTNASGGDEKINTVRLSFDGFNPGTNHAAGDTLKMHLRIQSVPYRWGLICALSESSAKVGNTTIIKPSQAGDVSDWTFPGVEAEVQADGTASFNVKVQTIFTKAAPTVNFEDETLTIEKKVTIKNLFPTADHYSITYNMNDESDTVHSTEYVPKENRGATRPADPTRAGYTFKGWCTKTTNVESGEAILTAYDFATPVRADLKLYADWTADTEKFTVKWDGVYTGVSNLPAVQEVAANTVIQEAPDEVPLREGYTFAGWATSENGNAVNFPQKITAHTTFYAKWAKNILRLRSRNV